MLSCLARRLVLWVLFPYFLFLALVKCPAGSEPSDLVSQVACSSLQNYVYPAWNRHVQPVLGAVDGKIQLSEKLSPAVVAAKSHWHQWDAQYQISYHASVVSAKASLHAVDAYQKTTRVLGSQAGYWWARFLSYWSKSMTPLLVHWGRQYRSVLEGGVDYTARHFRLKSWLVASYFRSQASRVSAVYVMPYTARAWAHIRGSAPVSTVLQLPAMQWLAERYSHFYTVFLEQSALVNASLQAKKDFVQAEFANFMKSQKSAPAFKQERDSIATVVNELLEAVAASSSSLSASTTAFSTATEIPALESLLDADSEVVETETLTLTRTVTQASAPSGSAAPSNGDAPPNGDAPSEKTKAMPSDVALHEDEDVIAYGSDSSQAQLDHELAYWESKVQNTLDLATESLESEMEPFLTAKLDLLKEQISANFSQLSQDTYKRYAAMADLIKSIDKDSEFISEHHEIIQEPEVHRQVMRDHISECHQVVEDTMRHVESHLNAAHIEIMTRYFEAAQSTVDVLESYAETAMSDFSARLTALIDILQHGADYSDSMSWKAWKKFHSVKESIFQIRDRIFDEANAYKTAPRGTKVPMGLKMWAKYLNNMNFHIRFLTQDNAEYLQIVRAKANVAYQQRELLTYELEQEMAKEHEAAQIEASSASSSAAAAASQQADSDAAVAFDAAADAAVESNPALPDEPDAVAPGVIVEEAADEPEPVLESDNVSSASVSVSVSGSATEPGADTVETLTLTQTVVETLDDPEAVFSILPVDVDAQYLEADESLEYVAEAVEEAL